MAIPSNAGAHGPAAPCIPLRNAMPGRVTLPMSIQSPIRGAYRKRGWPSVRVAAAWPTPQSPPVDMWTTRRALSTCPQAQHQQKAKDSLAAQGSDSTTKGGCAPIRGG